MIDLSVIIVSWNCRSYTLECLRSMDAGSTPDWMEIILVDNASGDGTVESVRDAFPAVRVIANTVNVGFAAANNQAISTSAGRYILLLNPDTLVHGDAFGTMVRWLDAHTDVGGAGPALRNGDGTPQYTGIRFPSVWNLIVESFFLDRIAPRSTVFGRHRSLFNDFTRPFDADYLQGSCLMLRRSVLEKVGVLDESFFMYFEETDLCYRIKQAGFRIVYLPDAVITHFGGGEEGHFTERRLLHYHRSLLKFFGKHHTAAGTTVLRAVLIIRSVIRIIAWSLTYMVRPAVRSKAPSIITGYVKTFPVILSGK